MFKDTIRWLEEIGADHYNIIPLNRKKRTLQGLLHQRLRGNKRLVELGLSQGEHTGLPWLFTIVEGLYELIDINDKILNKVSIPQIFSNQNSVTNDTAYNYFRKCHCNDKISHALASFSQNKSIHIINEIRAWIVHDQCYEYYDNLLKKQSKVSSLGQTINIIGEEIARVLWKKDWIRYYNQLTEELRDFKGK